MAKGELIPDGEILYKYIHPSAIPNGQEELPHGIFQVSELSTDWKKYREDPTTSFHIKEGKSLIVEIYVHDEIRNPRNPKRNGMVVDAWKQEIIHDPVLKSEDPVHGENLASVARMEPAESGVGLISSVWRYFCPSQPGRV